MKTSKTVVIVLAVALVLCVAFIFARFSFPPVINTGSASDRNIVSSSGDAIIDVVPDMAVISLGVMNQNVNLQKAYAENKAKMEPILKELEKLGVDKKDIKTSSFIVTPTYDYTNGTNKITGYQVSNTVTVNVRKIDDTGKILESAVLNQANAITGITFKIADDKVVYQNALKQAVKNAEEKAKILVGVFGNKKLTAVTIKEISINEPQQPIIFDKLAADLSAGAPVSKGTVEIRASVSVDFQY